MDMEKIILDTDIGSDIDDAVCLAYLLAQPRCELLGVTTVSGQPVERAMMVSAMLRVAGRNDIPVYPGAPEPLLTPVRQSEAPQAKRLINWPHDESFPQGEAIAFMRRTIEQNPGEVTLLAIGPMTNAGLLLAQDPAIGRKLKRIVLMNGSFLHQLPGVSYNEWNSLNDPYATAIVYKAQAPVHRSVGLDVTMQVQMDAHQVQERFSRHPLLQIVRDFSAVWFEKASLMTFHDPLACVSIFDDGILEYERGIVTIELDSKPMMGVTHFKKDASGPHEIAARVDKQRFFDSLFSVFEQ